MNTKNKPAHVSIIILNWNGWQDTIECLESALKLDYAKFSIILIDNDSTDDSVERISNWFTGKIKEHISTNFPRLIEPYTKKPVALKIADLSDWKKLQLNPDINLLFLKSEKNLGFAAGNNQGIKIASFFFKSTYYFLLNNDTVIEKSGLSQLVNALEENEHFEAVQSVIYYYNQPDKIANAGGKIFFWGQTKYYVTIGPNQLRDISFINGCALLVRSSTFKKIGPLSDKFFFGEEDFELSMRLKKNNMHMACCASSVVYHKIGTSSKTLLKDNARVLYLFGLNRMVDMKSFYPNILWSIWKYAVVSYWWILLVTRYKTGIARAFKIMRSLLRESTSLKSVKRTDVERIVHNLQL